MARHRQLQPCIFKAVWTHTFSTRQKASEEHLALRLFPFDSFPCPRVACALVPIICWEIVLSLCYPTGMPTFARKRQFNFLNK